jgi:hypothetical protein
MLATIYTFLVERDVAGAQVLVPMLTIAGIVLIAAALYVVLRQVVVRLISRLAERTRTQWDDMFVKRGVFHRLAALAPGILAHMLAGLWMGPDTPMAAAGNAMQLTATLWMLLFGMLAIHAFLDALVLKQAYSVYFSTNVATDFFGTAITRQPRAA